MSFAHGQLASTRIPGSPFDSGAGPYGAVTADLNNDGISDLAFAAYGSSSITVLLGDGKGGFTPAPGSPARAGGETLNVATGRAPIPASETYKGFTHGFSYQ